MADLLTCLFPPKPVTLQFTNVQVKIWKGWVFNLAQFAWYYFSLVTIQFIPNNTQFIHFGELRILSNIVKAAENLLPSKPIRLGKYVSHRVTGRVWDYCWVHRGSKIWWRLTSCAVCMNVLLRCVTKLLSNDKWKRGNNLSSFHFITSFYLVLVFLSKLCSLLSYLLYC